MTRIMAISLCIFGLQAASACAAQNATQDVADRVYMNGIIHTQDDARTKAQAVAIKNGTFVAVGRDQDLKRYIGPGTEVMDLQGKTVMPGIIDAHGHYVRGFKRELFNCDFPSSTPAAAIAEKVEACVERAKPGEWVVGGAWASSYASTGTVNKAVLDAVSPDNPVYLLDDTGHNGYVNSRALAAAGFTKEKARQMPAIVTDDSGEPTGILQEDAAGALTRIIPPMSDENYQAVVKHAVERANRYGITTFVEARTDRPTIRAYHDVDEMHGLTARVVAFLQYGTDFNESRETQRETLDQHQRYQSRNVEANNAKFYLDGVPPAFTAALLSPYQVDALHEHHLPDDFRGTLRMSPDTLRKDAIALDQQGITLKFHAAGDAAVREALDTLEAVRRANPDGHLHHSIAHVGMASPNDLPRFKTLDVTADIAPPIWVKGPYSDTMTEVLGTARYARTPPTAELLKAGAVIAYGSDWPSIAASINPWPSLASMVHRDIGPEQSIPLEAAIDTMTRGGAWSVNKSAEIGSIEPGKSADMVVIDRDPFAISADDIADIEVLSTVFRGKTVYQRDRVGE
ncbi:amidohydrolase [Larsenimonas suaedae]|uniref:Amidohydrolase n=1 Tax=Larsenimonas suaedae TaxID=1851019 RepID=A0ABU1GWJ5_9GAMM|nr:amidohydrolase [Larsenimonas suaedae]MCM2973307.1 amidohydrolase [Larsenimonas suaedae]MDR5896200.1 amidohydrolase [Larsenimonas suaedae]